VVSNFAFINCIEYIFRSLDSKDITKGIYNPAHGVRPFVGPRCQCCQPVPINISWTTRYRDVAEVMLLISWATLAQSLRNSLYWSSSSLLTTHLKTQLFKLLPFS